MKTLIILLLTSLTGFAATVTNITVSGAVTMSGAIQLTNYVQPQVTTPGFTVTNDYKTGGNVVITNNTSGSTFYWTTNAWTAQHSGAIVSNMVEGTISAYATKVGYTQSSTNTSASFTNAACTLSLTYDGGNISGGPGYNDSYYYTGIFFTNSTTGNICKLGVELYSASTNDYSFLGSHPLRVAVWSLSGENLDTELGYGTAVLGATGWYEISLSDVAEVTSGTTYAITQTLSNSDANNYVNMTEGNTAGGSWGSYAKWLSSKTKASGPSWTTSISVKVYYQ